MMRGKRSDGGASEQTTSAQPPTTRAQKVRQPGSLASSSTSSNVVNSQTGEATNNRPLVFGLNPRANKLKHDEHVERRAKQYQLELLSSPRNQMVSSKAAATKVLTVRQRTSNSPERAKIVEQQVPSSTGGAPAPAPAAADETARTRARVRREDKYKKRDTSPAAKMATENLEEKENNTSAKENKKMQFNIPPPPKVNSGSMTKSSIISYAKSRIYDKQQSFQQNKHHQQPPLSSELLDGNIPASISSGFKPPKQVNVSKARERWEGGEPFAKCKSRQRLAQSAANKKLLYGSWSMTSVVATQQLQFQQALAQSQSPRAGISPTGGDPNDTPVKILTRGSVLERVQQYEQVPASGLRLSSSTGSISSSTSSSTTTSSGSSSPSSPSSPSADEPLTPERQDSKPAAAADQILSAALLNRRFSFTTARRRSSASGTFVAIPRFYHPNGKPNTYEIELQKKNIVACFDKFTDRKALLTAPAYRRHFHQIALACGFSEYFKEPLYRYVRHQMTTTNLLAQSNATIAGRKQSVAVNGISPQQQQQQQQAPNRVTNHPLTRAASVDNSTVEKIQNQTYITCDQFLTCWRHLISTCFDNAARFVHLLTLGTRQHLLPEDFVPLLQSVIEDHPGLKFLRSAPDFHMRYIQTVVARIYFCVNRSWTGKLSVSELRRSDLLQVLEKLAREEDINQVTEYFSYEHFYVIYCKFWSLDQDHDLLISKEDLARHQEAAISSRIIDRIFTGVVSRRIQETGKMSYSDFVWFLLAEENKKHPRSIEYWFRLMDIDGDGYISMYEMEYFYYEQTRRLELMNIEALPFLDSACQILDLVNPKEKNKISLSDLKRTKLVTIFFDTFINIEKYLEHESREFVSSRDCIVNGQLVSDWDRYASEAYENLVTEESSV